MKIHVLFEARTNASGGGNQFLKGLRSWLEAQSCYAQTPEDADVFLFNSHQHIDAVARMKRRYPEKPFIHRIDGPMRLYNRMSDRRDLVVNAANRLIADATVFQSSWSREKNLSLGLIPTPFEAVILNAPDPTIFNAEGKAPFASSGKIRLIAVSWSVNENKGFDVYRWLDANLDFTRYEMVFVGNSPEKFKNIKMIPALDSLGVARELKKSDIYVTASKFESCSNTLIEALHCGLIAVAVDNTSHAECIGGRGEIFSDSEGILRLMEKISRTPEKYLECPPPPDIAAIGKEYYAFAQTVRAAIEKGGYRSKKLNGWGLLDLNCTRFGCAIQARGKSLWNRYF